MPLEILHQTTTILALPLRTAELYLIEILHQTTTINDIHAFLYRCILSKFYIKPQRGRLQIVTAARCILSKFYIKPQRLVALVFSDAVVSYRNSTSNHNVSLCFFVLLKLYLIEILHQTTTRDAWEAQNRPLYLIEILHQTTTIHATCRTKKSCILSKFYIKPQLLNFSDSSDCVVSYRNSTSNHNFVGAICIASGVVSYRNSTSNHNHGRPVTETLYVVSYRNSTSNHNVPEAPDARVKLYLIEILHQTTTKCKGEVESICCILSKFYIKPQLFSIAWPATWCCILSKFYIKPQLFYGV